MRDRARIHDRVVVPRCGQREDITVTPDKTVFSSCEPLSTYTWQAVYTYRNMMGGIFSWTWVSLGLLTHTGGPWVTMDMHKLPPHQLLSQEKRTLIA